MSVIEGPNIVKNGLIYLFDVANTDCYPLPLTGSIFYNVVERSSTGSIVGDISYLDTNKGILNIVSPSLTSTNILFIPQITFTDGEERTLEFVFRMGGTTTTTTYSLCGYGSTVRWCLIVRSGASSLSIRFRETDSTYNSTTVTTTFNNAWHYITYVFKTDRTIDIYYKGNYHATLSPTSTHQIISRIGSGYSSGGNSYSMNGYWAQTRIYNRALAANEILQNFNSLRGRFDI